eukprot:COSAG01_NODE_18050_length_1103_cov_3.163347_1_plen_244_part_10
MRSCDLLSCADELGPDYEDWIQGVLGGLYLQPVDKAERPAWVQAFEKQKEVLARRGDSQMESAAQSHPEEKAKYEPVNPEANASAHAKLHRALVKINVANAFQTLHCPQCNLPMRVGQVLCHDCKMKQATQSQLDAQVAAEQDWEAAQAATAANQAALQAARAAEAAATAEMTLAATRAAAERAAHVRASTWEERHEQQVAQLLQTQQPSQPLSRSEEARIRQLFDEMDTDGNGDLDADEIAAM